MNKHAYSLLISLVFLASSSQADTLRQPISHPSPTGSYQYFRLDPRMEIAPLESPCAELGTIYMNTLAGPVICRDTDDTAGENLQWSSFRTASGGVWTQDGALVTLTDPPATNGALDSAWTIPADSSAAELFNLSGTAVGTGICKLVLDGSGGGDTSIFARGSVAPSDATLSPLVPSELEEYYTNVAKRLPTRWFIWSPKYASLHAYARGTLPVLGPYSYVLGLTPASAPAAYATILGPGNPNTATASGQYAFLVRPNTSSNNTLQTNGQFSFIGNAGSIWGAAAQKDYCSIMMGMTSASSISAAKNAPMLTIGAGNNNQITINATSSFVTHATILGGNNNYLSYKIFYVPMSFTLLGGGLNNHLTDSPESALIGGEQNYIEASLLSLIGGGWVNHITLSRNSVILGGSGSDITSSVCSAAFGGSNDITDSTGSVVAGGIGNIITGSNFSGIVGGQNNQISAPYSFIGAGSNNSIAGPYGVIGGGSNNQILGGSYAFIPGGQNNQVNGSYSTAIGSNILIENGSEYNLFMGRNIRNTAGARRDMIFAWGYDVAADLPEYSFLILGQQAIVNSATVYYGKLNICANNILAGVWRANPVSTLTIEGSFQIDNGALYLTGLTTVDTEEADDKKLKRKIASENLPLKPLWSLGYDVAETFTADEPLEPGDTVILSPSNAGHVMKTSVAHDPRAIGVVSLAPAMTLEGDQTILTPEPIDGPIDAGGRAPIALAGQVMIKICGENGAVQPGDALVSASRPGYAMRAGTARAAFGSVIGKAMEPFKPETIESTGWIRAYVNRR